MASQESNAAESSAVATAPTGFIDQVQRVIEEDINPYLAMHSGGCELLDVDDGIVTLRLFGGCSGCPSSQITLFNGIIPILKEKIPDIKDVLLG